MASALVMGDLNAVVAAQEGHFGLLDREGIGDGCGDLGRSERYPRGKAKDLNDQSCGKMWGFSLEGDRGVVAISREVRVQFSCGSEFRR